MAGAHTRRPGRVKLLFLMVVCAILSVALIGVLAAQRQDQARMAAVKQANAIADPILALCAQGGDVGARLASAGLCGTAAAVKVNPADTPPGLTEDQVDALVQEQLAKQRPPQPVGPTPAQLAAAVQAFIAANPDYFKAPAPTSQQIQSAVAAYIRAHPTETAPVVQPPPTVLPQPYVPPAYQMPGLGGFNNTPGGVWSQPWPRSRPPR
jgi:hypothetical protein